MGSVHRSQQAKEERRNTMNNLEKQPGEAVQQTYDENVNDAVKIFHDRLERYRASGSDVDPDEVANEIVPNLRSQAAKMMVRKAAREAK